MSPNEPTPEEAEKAAQKRLFAQIKKTDYKKAPFTLWIVRKYATTEPSDGSTASKYRYVVRRLNTDPKVDAKLTSAICGRIQSTTRIEPYSFEGSVEAATALVERLDQTAFASIITQVRSAAAGDIVEDIKYLYGAYGYLVQLQPKSGPELFAFRRVQAGWNAKKLTGLMNLLYRNNTLVDLEEQQIFRFDRKIDFFGSGDSVFIFDKSGFESALNFRLGMEQKRDELIDQLQATELYSNLELVRTLSKTHVRWLKKLAGAHKIGKCHEKSWVEKLIQCCEARSWPIRLVDGKVQITEANCERIVRLMNYDLLESPVDQLLFQIDGAKEAVT